MVLLVEQDCKMVKEANEPTWLNNSTLLRIADSVVCHLMLYKSFQKRHKTPEMKESMLTFRIVYFHLGKRFMKTHALLI